MKNFMKKIIITLIIIASLFTGFILRGVLEGNGLFGYVIMNEIELDFNSMDKDEQKLYIWGQEGSIK